MIIYIVSQGCKYEGGWVTGVFLTSEAARKRIDDHLDQETEPHEGFDPPTVRHEQTKRGDYWWIDEIDYVCIQPWETET